MHPPGGVCLDLQQASCLTAANLKQCGRDGSKPSFQNQTAAVIADRQKKRNKTPQLRCAVLTLCSTVLPSGTRKRHCRAPRAVSSLHSCAMPAWAVDSEALRHLLKAQAHLLLLMPPPLQRRLYHLGGRPCKLLRLLPCIAGLHSGRLVIDGARPTFGLCGPCPSHDAVTSSCASWTSCSTC